MSEIVRIIKNIKRDFLRFSDISDNFDVFYVSISFDIFLEILTISDIFDNFDSKQTI